ncbi:MAG TPA: multifunctional CCA addition/repair protein, partial [Gammaproteobacteria bacterium]|nr:multifunctional CCA addition/repair protein [Gammaproteobacteria bacterium]
METFLVGGAVRDRLLGREVKERDWVVVGATAEEMVRLGYRQVGKDFPVFLHPETHEEYALARTERKTAPGYHGFQVHASPDVTLEQDLLRRDLTVNALAEDPSGQIIDYYGGMADLENRLLRHVSPAFAEDPVRILRVARFAARYAHLGFAVAGETLELMRDMVNRGEADALVAERIWQELEKALGEKSPEVFFEVLRECGALAIIFPEIDRLFGVPQPAKYHPEIDTGVHTLLVLREAASDSSVPRVRFAALTHDLGKGTTPRSILPSHHGHEERGAKLVEVMCRRLRAPKAWREMAVLVARYHTHVHRSRELKPGTLLKTLEALDAFRRSDRFREILICCEADSHGRTGLEHKPYPQHAYMLEAQQVAASVPIKPLLEKGLKGEALAEALKRQR